MPTQRVEGEGRSRATSSPGKGCPRNWRQPITIRESNGLDPRGKPFDGLMEADVVLRRGGGVVGRRVPDGADGIAGLRARGLHPRWTEGVFKKWGVTEAIGAKNIQPREVVATCWGAREIKRTMRWTESFCVPKGRLSCHN